MPGEMRINWNWAAREIKDINKEVEGAVLCDVKNYKLHMHIDYEELLNFHFFNHTKKKIMQSCKESILISGSRFEG